MQLFDLDRFQEIWQTITRNKARSLLTGFGVFWGIFMLVIMMGAGHGLERGMMKGIDGFATNSCFMGSSITSLPYKGFQKGRSWNIHNRDLDILSKSIPEIECLSPILWGHRSTNNVVYKENSGSYNIRGLHPNYVKIEQQRMMYGRFINDIDIVQARKVCLIGTTVYEELFPTKGNPLGQYIRVNGIYYQVIGVSSGVAQISISGRSEESVIIPFTTMQQVNNQGDIIHMLAASALPNIPVKEVQEKMETVLKSHNIISPDDKQAIWSFNLEEQFNMFKYLFLGISIVMWIVGSGTLIAGIVGVSNILTVTIKERTKEIGIRRALGAKPRTIMGQIIWEGLVLTSISGLSGLCFGVLCLNLANTYWLENAEDVFLSDPMISFGAAIASLIILMGFGLIAGSLPARRALRIKAIEAIREE
ncbi:MAG: ABC transporter permease [Dysgonamonadaceae bacterium]|jgi:putative ABC transport system permease protein|nr:ABC transporter permease [Dysgonamonadaceae bacterium]